MSIALWFLTFCMDRPIDNTSSATHTWLLDRWPPIAGGLILWLLVLVALGRHVWIGRSRHEFRLMDEIETTAFDPYPDGLANIGTGKGVG